MILQRAGQNLGGRSGAPVYQNHDGILAPALAALGDELGFRRRPAVVRNDELALVEKPVGHVNSLLHQPAGVIAQIENQAVDSAFGKARQRLIHFMAGGFVERFHAHVRDARAQPEGVIDAAARDIVANQGEVHRLGMSGAPHSNGNRGPLRPLQHSGDLRHCGALGIGIVHGNDLVGRPQTGAEGRRVDERIHHDHFAFGRTDIHPDAEVMAGLSFAHERVSFGIEEIGMRVEGAKHVRDRALKHRVIGIRFVGEITLYRFVDLGELFQARVHIRFRLRGESQGERADQQKRAQ